MKASQRLQELVPLVKHKFAFNFACQFSYLTNKVVLEEVSFFFLHPLIVLLAV